MCDDDWTPLLLIFPGWLLRGERAPCVWECGARGGQGSNQVPAPGLWNSAYGGKVLDHIDHLDAMQEAERIALEEHGSNKMSVISGVGTRDYYRKLGYKLDGPYMSKSLL